MAGDPECERLQMTSTNDDTWILIPVYNEAPVIADVVDEVLATFPNVVCVDDGSRDGSSAQVLRTKAHLVRHPINMGQGAALQTALKYALNRQGAKYFITFDADGQHRVEDALKMLDVARSGAAQIVIGSRFLEQVKNVPWIRRLMLRTVAWLDPSSRKLGLTDAHNGLRVLSREPAEGLKITMNGMAHGTEIISLFTRGGWTVKEVPVTVLYTEYSRAKGQSLMNGVNILFDLFFSKRGK